MILRGRRIVAGRAEGEALASSVPFSFVGGVDPATGTVLDDDTGCAGQRLAGRVFAFPRGKGSTVGSYAIYGLAKRELGPAAILNARAEAIVAVGAILGGVPMVDGIDVGGILSGDRVVVDADAAEVVLPEITAKPVVSAFLRARGRILLVRRSERVSTFPGRWSVIAGYIEGDEDPKDRARMEIQEETGIRGARLRAEAPAIIARDRGTAFIVHPLLFDAPTTAVRLDWENVEARWIRPDEIDTFDTVPRLKEAMMSLLFPPKARGTG